MKVDFNNMRLQLARAFNNLTSELNDLQSDIDEPHYVQRVLASIQTILSW